MEKICSRDYLKLLTDGKVPLFSTINNREIYLKENRWFYVDSDKRAINPFILHCKHDGCNKIVRNRGEYCPEHVDWSKKSHGASILTDDDVKYISDNVDVLSDDELTTILISGHTDVKYKSLLIAIGHHRRKYLNKRYTGKNNYKSVKLKYKEEHKKCAICDWNDAEIDLHHILQRKDFEDETDYYLTNNMICICPNHHRFVEEMRRKDMKKYLIYITPFKENIDKKDYEYT